MTSHPLDAAPQNEPPGAVGGAARDGSTLRRSRASRVVRGGVWLGIAGFLVTLIGAVLLGNGPGELELVGDFVHRLGMIMMLGGFIVVLIGYRWDALGAFFQPAVGLATSVSSEPRREQAVRALFDSLPPPLPPPVVDAEFAEGRPAVDRTADPPRRTGTGDQVSEPMAERYSSDIRTTPPPNVHTWGCLISAWSVVGIGFGILGLLYWIGSPRDAMFLSLLLDMLLVVVCLAAAVAWSGRKRAFAVGLAVPLVAMVIAKCPLIQSGMMIVPWSGAMYGNYPPSWEWRIIDVGFHLLALLTGFLGWLVVRTLEVLDASRAVRKGGPR